MPKTNLDVLDLKILRTLQVEGRLSNVELADRIGLSPSPCLRRVKRLEAEGIIEAYGARINRAKVGVSVWGCVVRAHKKPIGRGQPHQGSLERGMPAPISFMLVQSDRFVNLQSRPEE